MTEVALAAGPRGAPRPIRARRAPRAVAAVWLWQGALAVLVAGPAASAAAGALGGSPDGDAVLARPGGHVLLDMLLRQGAAVRAAITSAGLVILAAAIVGLVATAALMEAMSHPARGARPIDVGRSLSAAARAFPAFLVLVLLFVVSEGATGSAAWLVGTLLEGWTHASLGEARAEQLGLVAGAAFAPAAIAIAIVHDLARAEVVRGRRGAIDAVARAIGSVRRSPLALFWGYAWRGVSGLAVVVAAALADSAFATGAGAAAVLAGAVLHQGVALARVGLRASWLALALRRASPR